MAIGGKFPSELVLQEPVGHQEALQADTVKVVGADSGKIVKSITMLREDTEEYQCIICMANVFRDGKACAKIGNFSVRKN